MNNTTAAVNLSNALKPKNQFKQIERNGQLYQVEIDGQGKLVGQPQLVGGGQGGAMPQPPMRAGAGGGFNAPPQPKAGQPYQGANGSWMQDQTDAQGNVVGSRPMPGYGRYQEPKKEDKKTYSPKAQDLIDRGFTYGSPEFIAEINKKPEPAQMTPYQQATINQRQAKIDNPSQKPMNSDQAKASGFYDRMAGAEEIFTNLTTNLDPASGERTRNGFKPGDRTEQYRPHWMQSSEYQRYKNGADDWIRAKLRRESGAVIGPEEMEKEYEIYFPQPGDSQDLVAQKVDLRKRAQDGMKKSIGQMQEFENPFANASNEELLNF